MGISRRVVVTGMGTANPLGLDPEATWQAVLSGQSGVGPITRFDASEAPVRFAAEVKRFEPERLLAAHGLEPREVKRLGRYAQLALYAGLQAYQDAGLERLRPALADEAIGVNVGTGFGGLPEIFAGHNQFLARGYRHISPFLILQALPNIASGQLAIQLRLKGPNQCNSEACATSTHSVGEAFRLIQHGQVEVMLAGGAEAVVYELAVGSFAAMRALSARNDDPARASRPFDRGRDGFVLGEGATVLVLESYELARRRGARIYGEILGYGASGDGHHLVHPAPGGAGAARAMRAALAEAGASPDRVDYVNAHATSTPTGDVEEAQAIAGLLSPGRDRPLYVSSTKSVTGHLIGAAGGTEAMFSLLALRDQVLPATAHLEQLDPRCQCDGLQFLAGAALATGVELVLSNSFGFGGSNGSLLLGRVS
jgi:3-oxoacyl-[acyl-carrier-protein] synthase II